MRDSELVLRFLAFDTNLSEYQGDFKVFLDNTTRTFESAWKTRETEVMQVFARLDLALEVAKRLFGNDAFKKWLGDRYERVINRAIFDSVARFFADKVVASAIQGNEEKVIDALKTLCLDTEFKEAIEKTTKSKASVFNRINKWGEVLAGCIGKQYDKQTNRIV